MSKEIWKDIKGYEGYYKVSSLGNFKSIDRTVKSKKGYMSFRGRLLKQSICKKGYWLVYLSKNGTRKTYKSHTIIANHFLNGSKKKEVNHIDCNKLNNSVVNLEWSTRLENMKHAKINKLVCTGERHGMSKFKDTDIIKIRDMYKDGASTEYLAESYNVAKSTIIRIVKRRTWAHL